ncbi:MAG: imidazole glycerol phosphate synthase subunit HisH [Flavobacterium sp.]|uniref:imidazole glycerol phosphate synthase subunit HisH n=1 Tax=unclassified Flavobacterium TaxID=196869 RepID=UPI000C40E1F8|nr:MULTISPECIES: imidazole glycerol phosphate synthase subunit HisH [unclassified Flavobacterium]MBF03148.1 imidazole glycerol phosphate synthase subunit HisH [Flavobacterium sp.]MCO6163423.1 imidazole glycerol phosphate synthase subunit HisH [Flavobacterium sp. NRK F7]|tara:strand:- start:1920 stop:2507 length:588 start_codon:yes stop_codon:yes gene_type:complete
MKIAIIDYGAGNIQSILFALERIGIQAQVTANWNEIKNADKIIFPGVGEASSAMEKLKESGLHILIPTLKQPVLGICLGMQLLCKSSEEGATTGLGVFDIDIIKFSNAVKVPQMGWNSIYQLKSALFDGISENEYMYLVHSYYAPKNSYAIAYTNYETEYATALRKDNFYGVQFHPEKSGVYGEKILKNFIAITN